MPDLPDRLHEFDAQLARERREDASDAAWLGGLMVIGAGAYALGRKGKVNVFAELLDKAGRSARFLGHLSNKGVRRPVFQPETSDLLYQALRIPRDAGGEALQRGLAGGRLENVDLVRDLGNAIAILQDPRNHSNVQEMTRLFREHFRNLPTTRGRATPSGFHHELHPLTFDQVLERSSDWIDTVASSAMPTRTAGGKTKPLSIGIVEKALEMEWITRETIVDSNLFVSMGRKPGRLIDTRILRPRQLMSQISDIFDPFGIVNASKALFGSAQNVAVIGPARGGKGRRLFLGGDVYDIFDRGLKKTHTGQTLGTVGDIRHLPAALREAQFDRKLRDLYHEVPHDTLLGRLADKTGVGRRFHDKRGIGFAWAANVLKRVRGVGSGEAVFFARDFKYKENSVLGLLLGAQHPEVVAKAATREIVEGKYAGKAFMEAKDLPWWDRVKAYMGISDDITVVKSEARKKARISKDDLYADYGKGGIKSIETPIRTRAEAEGATGVSLMGQLDFTERSPFYTTSGFLADKAYDFANYLTIRLNSLASSSLLGIGFRPSGNAAANVGRLASIPAIYYTAFEGLRYTDYVMEEATGISPIESAATLYTKARVAQQQAREFTGIQQTAEYAEENIFPGLSVGFLGTVASATLGLALLGKTGSRKIAGLGFASIYGAIGGPEVSQPAEELEEIYAGDRKVPIKKARWWLLGYQPFSGEEIDHYSPSWYQKLKNKPWQRNVAGSEAAYWRDASFLPTPHNFFGVRMLVDPYALERSQYHRRPYPMTSAMFEEVPIIGPILADTVGEIIKPRRERMPDEAVATATSFISQKGVPADAAQRLGIPDIPGQLIDMNRPDILRDRLQKYANVALEPTGIWKFALETFGVKFDDEYKMADAGNMASISRQFYGANLGGLFGQTEFIRRFLMSDYGSPSQMNAQINPLANSLPSWLPGSRSQFENDRDFFVDFTRGDAYTKISGGEYRLPGPGYEAVNELQSGTAGVYSDVDKMLVLADIAPFSSAFYHFQKKVEQKSLDPRWARKVELALEQRQTKINKFQFEMETPQEAATRANANPLERSIRGAWDFTHDNVLRELPIVGSKFFPHTNPVDKYIKTRVEGETFADWNRPLETIVRPTFYDIAGEDPATGILKGASLGALMSIGVGKYMNPFRVVANDPALAIVGGAAAGGAASSARMIATGQLQGGFVPAHVEREREVQTYFDFLKYEKYRRLQGMAYDASQLDLAQKFQNQAKRTVAYGMADFEATGDIAAYQMALSRFDRPYFEAFLKIPEQDRERVLDVVPDHMAMVLQGAWGRQGKSGGGNSKAGFQGADEAAEDYFDSHPRPDGDWLGWHPSVPDAAVQIKLIQNNIFGVSDNIHRFGFYPAQEREADMRFPSLEYPKDIRGEPEDWLKRMFQLGLTGPMNYSRISLGTGPDLNIFNGVFHDHRRDDVFTFYNDMYR